MSTSKWSVLVIFLAFCEPVFPVASSQRCLNPGAEVVAGFKKIARYLNPSKLKKSNPEVYKLLKEDFSCRDSNEVEELTQEILSLTSRASGKVGVVLPLEGDNRSKTLALLSGMHAGISGKKSFSKKFLVRSSYGGFRSVERAVAELLLLENVSLLIGGLSQVESRMLANYARLFRIPYLNVGPYAQRNSYTYTVGPDPVGFIFALARYAELQRYENLAILIPSQEAKSKTTRTMIQALSRKGVEVETYTYQRNNYDSMEAAAKNLFQIDPIKRKEEFEELFEQKKLEVESQGVTFDPRFVSLPPIIDFDAVYIADHFRNVRHFVNIFKYLGVKKVPLVGDQQWRSIGLLDPPEEFLTGAVFMDFVGSYSRLPSGLQVLGSENPYLIPAKEIVSVDHKLIGYRVASIVQSSLKKSTEPPKLNSIIAKLSLPKDRYFSGGPVFRKNNNTKWPVFLLRVDPGRLSLYSSFR